MKKKLKCGQKKQNKKKIKSNSSKIIKKRGAINKDYTYIVFGKSNAYAQKQDVLCHYGQDFSKLKK